MSVQPVGVYILSLLKTCMLNKNCIELALTCCQWLAYVYIYMYIYIYISCVVCLHGSFGVTCSITSICSESYQFDVSTSSYCSTIASSTSFSNFNFIFNFIIIDGFKFNIYQHYTIRVPTMYYTICIYCMGYSCEADDSNSVTEAESCAVRTVSGCHDIRHLSAKSKSSQIQIPQGMKL